MKKRASMTKQSRPESGADAVREAGVSDSRLDEGV